MSTVDQVPDPHELRGPVATIDGDRESWPDGIRYTVECTCGWRKGNNYAEADATMWGRFHLEAARNGDAEADTHLPEYTLAESIQGVPDRELRWFFDQMFALHRKAVDAGCYRLAAWLIASPAAEVADEIARQSEMMLHAEIQVRGHVIDHIGHDRGPDMWIACCICDEDTTFQPTREAAIEDGRRHLVANGCDPENFELAEDSD